MAQFEYSVIPSPRKGKSAKGVRGTEAKFANALSTLMNDMGQNGWEYVRADTLPCEERQGLTGKTVKYHSILVFRRPVAEVEAETEDAKALLAPPVVIEPEDSAPEPMVEAISEEPIRPDPPLTAETDETETTEETRPVAAE